MKQMEWAENKQKEEEQRFGHTEEIWTEKLSNCIKKKKSPGVKGYADGEVPF